MAHEPHSLTDVVEGIEDLTEGKRKVCLGDALDQFGSRSFGPILVILPLLESSPLGAIPGFPTALSVLIALIAAQIALGREHLWIPAFIEKRPISARKLGRAAEKVEGVAAWIDKWFKGRLKWLTGATATRIAAFLIIGLCVLVPPLEFVPFAASAPMIAIAMFGLALMVRDGLLMLVASAATVGVLVTAVLVLGGGGAS